MNDGIAVAVIGVLGVALGGMFQSWREGSKTKSDDNARLRVELMEENRKLREDVERTASLLMAERATRITQEDECRRRVVELEARVHKLEEALREAGISE